MKIPKNYHGIWILTQCLSPYMRLLQVCWLHFWYWFVLYYRGSISESQLMSKVVSQNALALLSYIERLLQMLSGIVRWKQSFEKPIKWTFHSIQMLTVKEQWRWLIGKGHLLHIAMKYVLTSARKEVCMTNRRYDVKNIMQFTFPWIKGADDCGPLMGIGSYAIQFVCIRFRRDWQGLRESCSMWTHVPTHHKLEWLSARTTA